MKKPAHIIEIFLQPGDFYFGDRDTRIRTTLGSCVSITMWHPRLLIGGMCHFMLPTRSKGKSATLDGRYADEAMEMFMREIRTAGTRPVEYQVKLFGGGNMFPNSKKPRTDCPQMPCANPIECTCRNVSCRNERAAQLLVKQYGFSVQAACLGGSGHRQLFFDIWTGHVWSRYNPIIAPANVIKIA